MAMSEMAVTGMFYTRSECGEGVRFLVHTLWRCLIDTDVGKSLESSIFPGFPMVSIDRRAEM